MDFVNFTVVKIKSLKVYGKIINLLKLSLKYKNIENQKLAVFIKF